VVYVLYKDRQCHGRINDVDGSIPWQAVVGHYKDNGIISYVRPMDHYIVLVVGTTNMARTVSME
jgi:hypothetical protein